MDNLEKIQIINQRIDNINVHINILANDINDHPNEDVEGKPTRQSVLNDFMLKKQALLDELNKLA